MRNRSRLIIAACLSVAMLTGCWSRHELNDLAISVGMGFDKKGDDIQVTVQIVNPGEVASKKGGIGYAPPVTTFRATAKTTFEAIRKLTTIAPRKIYSSHLRILVIGEELARDGIAKVLDGVSRNHEFRTDFYLVVAKDTTAENVLNTLTPIEKIPANKLFLALEKSERAWAPTVKVKLNNLIDDLQEPGKDPVLTGIQINGNPSAGARKSNVNKTEPDTTLQYSGVAVFKNDKLIAWLNEQESKGYNFILDRVTSTVGHIDCPAGGVMALEVAETKTKMNAKLENGKPRIAIDTVIEENVGEVRCPVELNDHGTIRQLEKKVEDEVRNAMNSAIRKAKKYEVDIFGCGEAIYRANPKYWNQHKEDWARQFVDLPIDIHVKATIRRLGTVNDSPVGNTME